MEIYDDIVQQYSEAKAAFLAKRPDPAEQFMLKYLANPQGKTLLDVGCGTGDESQRYEKMGFVSVFGVDPSIEMLKQAHAKVAHPENFHTGAYEHTGMPDKSVDVVAGLYSFHYVQDLDKGYKELSRILRPGGVIVLAMRHPFSDLSETDRYIRNGMDYVNPIVYEAVPIEHPFHAIEDYLSPTFVTLFDLLEVKEWSNPALNNKSPFLLGIAAKRR